MKQALYFSHDANARNDIKMIALREKYGSKGYGCFWILIEMMREADGHCLTLNSLTFTVLKRELKLTEKDLNSFIKDCIDWELFAMESNNLFSPSLRNRMQIYSDKVEKAREAGRASAAARARTSERTEHASNQTISTNVEQETSERSTINEIKEKKIKVNKIKENEINPEQPILNLDLPSLQPKISDVDNVKLSDAEYKKLTDKYGEENTKKMITVLSNYKHQSGRKYKSDYHAILNWVVERVTEDKSNQTKQKRDEDVLRKRLGA
jgi:hypothetical protein